MIKMAITVYHDFKDFWEIPQFLDRLGLGYRFYLRHFTIYGEETVLFARAEREEKAKPEPKAETGPSQTLKS